MAVDSLQKAGHTVLPWEPYKHFVATGLISDVYASDGATVSPDIPLYLPSFVVRLSPPL